MKNLLKILGILCIVLAIVFFFYGSIKTAAGEEKGQTEIELEGGIVMLEDNQDQQLAQYGLTIAGVLGGAGILLLFLGRASSKQY